MWITDGMALEAAYLRLFELQGKFFSTFSTKVVSWRPAIWIELFLSKILDTKYSIQKGFSVETTKIIANVTVAIWQNNNHKFLKRGKIFVPLITW